jgi:bacterioferritin-associated ferredoxin
MIVCSCNIITRRDIEAVIEEILTQDPYAVLTPGLLYHRLGRRGKCGGCFPHVTEVLVTHGIWVRERIAQGKWPEPRAGELEKGCSSAA